ncbi:MAG TPA: ABC transporter permease [Rugosimonospora sp.]|jgi:ribose/xylose/arabinose/galactoside ABC-type transport system permease subunit
MTYGDQGYRFRGEGFRDEPDFRADTGSTPTYQPGGQSADSAGSTAAEGTGSLNLDRRGVSPAELDDVFDDPDHGDPGMDRMGVHMIWELLLLLATVGMAVYFEQTHHAQISGAPLRGLLLNAAVLGFLAIGVGLSLRAGVVNLAAGSTAAAAALFFASHSDRGLIPTAGVTLLLAAGVGAAIGLLVVVLHVPAWAASLAGALAVVVWIDKHVAAAKVTASYHPDRQAFYWYGGFAALALLGGVLGLVKPVRRGVSRFRPVGDPAARRGAVAGVMAFVAIVGSSVLAGLAGTLDALSSPSVAPSDGFLTTDLALGAVLAAGTSAYGRRGGVLGTVLSVSLITLVMGYSDADKLRISPYAVAAVAIGVGLVATRLVEAFGRPQPARRAEPEAAGWDGGTGGTEARSADATGQNWTGTRQSGGWSSQLPARSTDDTWGGASDERWGVK